MIRMQPFENDTLTGLLGDMERYINEHIEDTFAIQAVQIVKHVEVQDDESPWWFEGLIVWRENGLNGE